MARRERRKFSDEYKAEVVALVRSSGKSIGEISRDLDLTETAVREWVQRADVDGGKRNGLSTAEREELSRLRRQVRVLEEERSIHKKAATFFAVSRDQRNGSVNQSTSADSSGGTNGVAADLRTTTACTRTPATRTTFGGHRARAGMLASDGPADHAWPGQARDATHGVVARAEAIVPGGARGNQPRNQRRRDSSIDRPSARSGSIDGVT